MKNTQSRAMAFAAIQMLSSLSFAALDISQITGQKTIYNSTFGKQEVCVIANKLKPNDYKDKDAKDEQQLCGYDFYTNVGLCSKLNSTNPGTLVVELLSGKSRQETMRMCSSDDIKVEAKFKNSISCSYAPSILAYYHFSRMLKAGNVPVAVLRTMDKEEHLKVTKEALRILSSKPNDVIYKTWSSFLSEHQAGTNQNIFDTTGKFVYGALSDNPKGEYRYTEVSGVGSYDTRYERFLQQPPYKKVSSSARVSELAGSDQYKKIAPVVVQMKDVSDMILLDTLFSQDDRIGNIHYKLSWMIEKTDAATGKKSFDFEKSKASLASDKKTWIIPENEKAIQSSGAVLVKEMLLKDNDCGVNIDKRSNMMRKISALEGVRHMSGRTYKRFIEMYKMAQTPEFKNWMRNTLLFREADLGSNPATRSGKSFYGNLEKARSILVANCKSGALKLDLNVDDYIPGNAPQNYSCE